MTRQKPPPKVSIFKEVRRLLIALSVALLLCTVGVLGAVLSQKRTRIVSAGDLLFAPDLLLGKGSFGVASPPFRLDRSWVFDRVELVSFDALSGKEKSLPLPVEAYIRLYERLASEESIKEPLDQLEAAFDDGAPVRLRLVLAAKGKGALAISPVCYREVQLLPRKGLVRVQLTCDANPRPEDWAYFRSLGIERCLPTEKR